MDPFFYFDDDELDATEAVLATENSITSPTDTQDNVSMSAQNTENSGI